MKDKRIQLRRLRDRDDLQTLEDIKKILIEIDEQQDSIEAWLNDYLENLPYHIDLAVQRLLWNFVKKVFKALFMMTLMVPTWIFMLRVVQDGYIGGFFAWFLEML